MPPPASTIVVPSPEVRHLKPLDGVRGLAILMVVLSHAFESNSDGASLPLRFLASVFYFGKFGVDLFFVLSGFLITGLLVDTRNDPKFFQRFFARRALRILPLYYGVLVVLLALTQPLHLHWDGMAWPLLAYIQNYWPKRIQQLHVAPHLGLFHFWSLAVEEQFYLVWPFLVYWLRAKKRSVFWAATIGSVLALGLRLITLRLGVSGLAIQLATPTRMDSLLIGGMLAIAYRSASAWPRVERVAAWVFAAMAVPVVAMAVSMHGYDGTGHVLWRVAYRYTVLAVGFAAMIAWSLKPGSAARWMFERSWLRFLGKYSYGLYVFHVMVFACIDELRDVIRGVTGSKAQGVGGAAIICMLLSVLVAYASFHLYENHFLKLKRRFAYSKIEPAIPAAL